MTAAAAHVCREPYTPDPGGVFASCGRFSWGRIAPSFLRSCPF
jgi:hypothetical protein